MKQHITTEQLNELSNKGREKLRDSCNDDLGSLWTFYEEDVDKWYIYAIADDDSPGKLMRYPSGKSKKTYPLLSIGQMVEFLDLKLIDIELEADVWYVRLTGNEEYMQRNLVDTLWEAVKEVLEK